ncbi:hypothetical protein Tco_0646901 [Tanacetum coccineum]
MNCLPSLDNAFLEGDNKLPVIIAKELDVEEKSALVKVLKSHKRALAWKLSDIQGINPEFCTHKILMEEDYAQLPTIQRRISGNEYYCFLDGFLRYFQSPLTPVIKKKTTFTCPYERLAYRRMPSAYAISLHSFHMYDLAIFHDMVEIRGKSLCTTSRSFRGILSKTGGSGNLPLDTDASKV